MMTIIHDVDDDDNENSADDYLPLIMTIHDIDNIDNENAVDDYQPPGRRPPEGSVQALCPAMILGKLGTWAIMIKKRILYFQMEMILTFNHVGNPLLNHLHSL